MPSYSFRRLAPEALDDAYAILVEVTDWLLSNGIRQWAQPIPYEVYAARQQNGENYGLFVDDELAAVISLMAYRPDYWAEFLPQTDFRWVATLASARKFKGQKLGELALSEGEQFLAKDGIPAIYLDCMHGQGTLPQFYASLGYKHVARKEIEFPTGVMDAVLMRKKLNVR